MNPYKLHFVRDGEASVALRPDFDTLLDLRARAAHALTYDEGRSMLFDFREAERRVEAAKAALKDAEERLEKHIDSKLHDGWRIDHIPF